MSTAAPLLGSTNSELHRSVGEGCAADLPSSRPEPVSLVCELIWITIIVSVAVVVLGVFSKGETTEVPLRMWIVGFVILRVLRVVVVCLDYSHRRQVWEAAILDPDNTRKTALGSVSKCLHTINVVLVIIWWIVGLYWMFSGGKSLADDAPKLFWSTVVFMAFDLVVVLMFGFVSCMLYVLCCCFLQLIMPFRISDPNQNGANEDLMARLGAIQESPDGSINDRSDTDSLTKHAIPIPAENVV